MSMILKRIMHHNKLLDEISFQKYFLIKHVLGGVTIIVTVTISGWKYLQISI